MQSLGIKGIFDDAVNPVVYHNCIVMTLAETDGIEFGAPAEALAWRIYYIKAVVRPSRNVKSENAFAKTWFRDAKAATRMRIANVNGKTAVTKSASCSVTRHWTINGRFLTQPLSGVQRYAREIVSALDDAISEGSPLARNLALQLVFPSSASDVPSLRKIRLQPAGKIAGHLWEQFVLPARLRGGLLSFGNTGPLNATPHIVCIHDANTRAFPTSYTPAFRLLYRALIPSLGRTAKMVATVSRFSAAELERCGIARADKIIIMPDGHEHAMRWNPRHTSVTRVAASLETIVIIGSSAPHKNIKLILEMADRFAAVGLRIAVVGSADARVYNVGNGSAVANNVIWLGRLSDEELAALMRDSLCLAFPSLMEGFGLPALEAMVLGCPAVVSNVASLPEVCGDAVLYASPTDPGAWFNQILRLRNDEALRAKLIRKGRARAMQFSWRSSAELYLHAMAKIDGVNLSER